MRSVVLCKNGYKKGVIMDKSSRVRHFSLVFYGTDIELDKLLLTYNCRIAHYAHIKHDKDVYLEDMYEEDGKTLKHKKGELEKVHRHILISFYNAHTFSAVKKLFTTEEDKPRVEKITDIGAMYRYLTHKDNPEKYQYKDTDIVSDDINFYEKVLLEGTKKETDNISESIINDMLKGVSPRIMVSRYGRDYVIHMRQYKDCVQEIREWDVSHPTVDKIKNWDRELVQMGLLDEE